MKETKQNWNDPAYPNISFQENFGDMTSRDLKFFKRGFESAFKLISQYIQDGVDIETARKNAEEILSIESLDVKKRTKIRG